ncbi:MAG: beta-N-acetylhexosaminidase [Opitutaceae bacterium]|nr:beta-N-acetylhexosaminidase [Opitutaceae bacterium]
MKTLPLILPQPTQLTLTDGEWVRRHRGRDSSGLRLRISAAPTEYLAAQAALLAGYLEEENHFAAEIVPVAADGDIHLALTLSPRLLPTKLREAGFSDETYRLTVTPERILIEAASPDGISRGIQTLRQLLSGQRAQFAVPGMIVNDTPELGWRGLHLDVSRHFRDATDVKRFIDLAAFHKFNLLHWHLTDDQGWRLPVDGYPLLTEIAAWRDGTLVGHNDDRSKPATDGVRHGGAYTAEEIREVVAYAAARGVRILPEVDVPGHVQALVTAYPEFGNTDSVPGVRTRWGISSSTLNLELVTFVFLEKVVATLVELFPFHYLHFGGDEALPDEWIASPRIQAHKRELGLATEHEVQGYFTARLHELTRARGRAMIGWDEIIEHDRPPPDTAVMLWRDSTRNDLQLDLKALCAGNPLVLANHAHTYFDAYQAAGPGLDFEPLAIGGNLPLEKVYAWRPLADYPAELHDGLLGAQAQLWTEYIPTRRHLDYMTYPRACALAQVLWTGEGREDVDAFTRRLATHMPRLDRLGVAYRPTAPEGSLKSCFIKK